VRWLLQKDPLKRPRASEIIDHPWFVVQITEEEDGEKENMGNDKTAD
jgi:serine/threonine protein kinase